VTDIDENPRPALLELNDAHLARDGVAILRGMSLRIEQGQHTAILGPNGAGKSTLVRLIHRDDYPFAREPGERAPLRLFGRERWNVFELRKHMGIVSGDLQYRFVTDDLTDALDAVLAGFFSSQVIDVGMIVTRAQRMAAMKALERLGAAHLAHRRLPTLSTGEARRVLIARALAHDPGALLLDEPTTGLDFVAQRTLLETLRTLAHAGTTLVLVTHHLEEILPEIEHVIVLRGGRVFASGNKRDVLCAGILSEAYGAPIRVQERGGYYHAHIESRDG
jgi:iron complex transport system ATP-binding protein